MSEKSTEILLVDDDALVRQVLNTVLRSSFPGAVIGEASSVDEALGALESKPWTLIVLDLNLGEKSGLIVLHRVSMLGLGVPILVLSSQRDEQGAIPAFRAGARGFLSKTDATSPERIRIAIEKILAGGKYFSESVAAQLFDELHGRQHEDNAALSQQESRVLYYTAAGKSVKEIAGVMGISEKTVRTYRSRLLEKLDVKSDAEIVRYAIKHGIID